MITAFFLFLVSKVYGDSSVCLCGGACCSLGSAGRGDGSKFWEQAFVNYGAPQLTSYPRTDHQCLLHYLDRSAQIIDS